MQAIAALATEKAARIAAETKFSEHQALVATSAAQARADKAVADLKAAGTWIPAYDAVGVPAIFSALAAKSETIKFSDKDGKQVDADLMQAFSEVLAKVGKIVPAGKLFSAGTGGETRPSAAAAAAKITDVAVDQSSVTFSDMVQQRVDEKKIPYTQAYKELVQEGKRPEAGAAAAGAV